MNIHGICVSVIPFVVCVFVGCGVPQESPSAPVLADEPSTHAVTAPESDRPHFERTLGWPGWRGPNRDAIIGSGAVPVDWPRELKRLWRVDVGVGHASPVVEKGRIFQFARQGDEEVLLCFDLTGDPLWQSDRYSAPYQMNSSALGHGKGPKSTPIIADGRIYTLGISGILTCWDTTTGHLIWRNEFSSQFKQTSPLFGTATSPFVMDGICIAHVGGHDSGALMAFACETGEVVWSWDRDGPPYTSPIVATLSGQNQLVTQSQDHCLGVSIDRGKELWSFSYTTDYTMNIPTPVVAGSIVIFSGYQRGVTGYEIKMDDREWQVDEAWHTDDVYMYMSSPVLVDGRVYGFSQTKKGQFFCLWPNSGEIIWTAPGRQGDNALLLAIDDVMTAVTTEAEFIIFRRGRDDYVEVARYNVADTPTWAHHVVVGDQVLFKDEQSLSMWTWAR